LTSVAYPPEAVAGVAQVPLEPHTRSGDRAAMLFRTHWRRIYGYCLTQLRDRQEADDAAQSTFLYAFKLLERGDVPRNELPWLYTIAHNVCRTRRRALKRRNRVETPVDLDALHDVAGRPDPPRDELAGLGSSLAALPPAQRSALVLREWRGLSYSEIAASLGLSQAAVETLLFRARRNLARTLRASTRAASLSGVGMLLGRLRRLAPFTGSAKTTVAAVTLAVAAGGGVQRLVTSDHSARPRGTSPTVATAAPLPAATPAATSARAVETKIVRGKTQHAVPQELLVTRLLSPTALPQGLAHHAATAPARAVTALEQTPSASAPDAPVATNAPAETRDAPPAPAEQLDAPRLSAHPATAAVARATTTSVVSTADESTDPPASVDDVPARLQTVVGKVTGPVAKLVKGVTTPVQKAVSSTVTASATDLSNVTAPVQKLVSSAVAPPAAGTGTSTPPPAAAGSSSDQAAQQPAQATDAAQQVAAPVTQATQTVAQVVQPVQQTVSQVTSQLPQVDPGATVSSLLPHGS